MADRTDEIERRTPDQGVAGQPRTIAEARDELAQTRQRISRDLDVIEMRLRNTADDVRDRLDVLAPARSRIRADVWTSLALAFGAGLTLALLTGRNRHGRRRLPGRVLGGAARKLPGAILQGARLGLADRLREEWSGRAEPKAKLPRPAGTGPRTERSLAPNDRLDTA